MNGYIIDVVGAYIGGRLEVGRRLEAEHASGGIDRKQRRIRAARDGVAQARAGVRVSGCHRGHSCGILDNIDRCCSAAAVGRDHRRIVDRRYGQTEFVIDTQNAIRRRHSQIDVAVEIERRRSTERPRARIERQPRRQSHTADQRSRVGERIAIRIAKRVGW